MEQTNRTILFEEINPEQNNLLEMIGDVKGKESLTDEVVGNINKLLSVSTFQEAVEKFEPKVSIYLDTQKPAAGEAEHGKYHENVFEISLGRNSALLDSLIEMMQAKHTEEYIFPEIKEIINKSFYREDYTEFDRMQKEAFEFYCDSGFENAEKLILRILDNYDNGLFLLFHFIERMNKVLDGEGFTCQRNVIGEKRASQVRPIGISEDIKNGIPVSFQEQKEGYASLVRGCIKAAYDRGKVKNPRLLEAELIMTIKSDEKEQKELLDLYQKMTELYISVIKAFWRQAKPMTENLLGIYEFFAQYKQQPVIKKKVRTGYVSDEKETPIEEMKPKLLIANCSASAILNEENKNRLRIFLETVNQKNFYTDTIWYAIIPGISSSKTGKRDIRERFETGKDRIEYDSISCEDALELVNLLSEYDILSFISLECNSNSMFGQLKRKGISAFEYSFSFLDNAEKTEYMIPCFPNFNIIPDRYMAVSVKKTEGGTEKKWLDGIGLAAAYVAAGLAAACQSPEYLHRFYPSDTDVHVPGVAYRLSQGQHHMQTVTTMHRELIYIDEELLEEAVRHSRGVLFWPVGKNIAAVTDRVYSYRESMKDCISVIQTLTYLKRKIRYATQDFREDLIIGFFQNRPGNLKNQWSSNGKNVNAIIKTGEDLKCRMNEGNHECTFVMEFADITKQNTVKINQ